MADPILYEEAFTVKDVNSQKYDRVSRISCDSITTENGGLTFLTLDVNTELYPVIKDERVQIALASTLNLDGSRDDSKGWREVGRGEHTLANEYDYVCHGKVYRFDEAEGDNM